METQKIITGTKYNIKRVFQGQKNAIDIITELLVRDICANNHVDVCATKRYNSKSGPVC